MLARKTNDTKKIIEIVNTNTTRITEIIIGKMIGIVDRMEDGKVIAKDHHVGDITIPIVIVDTGVHGVNGNIITMKIVIDIEMVNTIMTIVDI